MGRGRRLAAARAHCHELAGDRAAAAAGYRDAARAATSLPERRYLEARGAELTAVATREASAAATREASAAATREASAAASAGQAGAGAGPATQAPERARNAGAPGRGA